MHEPLIQNIKELVPLKDTETLLIKEAFKRIQLNKKQFLLHKGEPSNYMRGSQSNGTILSVLTTYSNNHISKI